MLGQTHMTNSTLLLHAGLFYVGSYRYTKEVSTVDDFTLFNYTIDQPLNIIDYGLIVGISLVFVLMLLRIGNKQMRRFYIGIFVLQIFGLVLLSENSYGLQTAFIFIFFILGSVFPDIDSEESTIGQYIKPISRIIPHRTITHTLWVVLSLFILLLYVKSIYLFAFALGYTIHIIQDSFSRQGIAWFYPINSLGKNKLNSIFSYRTGESVELFILIVSIITHVGLFVGYMYIS